MDHGFAGAPVVVAQFPVVVAVAPFGVVRPAAARIDDGVPVALVFRVVPIIFAVIRIELAAAGVRADIVLCRTAYDVANRLVGVVGGNKAGRCASMRAVTQSRHTLIVGGADLARAEPRDARPRIAILGCGAETRRGRAVLRWVVLGTGRADGLTLSTRYLGREGATLQACLA